jgi:hypothetical protein
VERPVGKLYLGRENLPPGVIKLWTQRRTDRAITWY